MKPYEINSELVKACRCGSLSLVKHLINNRGANIDWRYNLVLYDNPSQISKIELFFDVEHQKFNPIANVIGFFTKAGGVSSPIILKHEKKIIKRKKKKRKKENIPNELIRTFGICKKSSKKILDIDFFLFLAKEYESTSKKIFYTPLNEAIASGSRWLINYLLKKEIDVKSDCYRNYPEIEIYETSLKNDWFSEDEFASSAEKDHKIYKIRWFNNPLHQAVKNGDIKTVTLLIEKGADLNATDEDGKTPLALALADENIDIAQLLLERGADQIG